MPAALRCAREPHVSPGRCVDLAPGLLGQGLHEKGAPNGPTARRTGRNHLVSFPLAEGQCPGLRSPAVFSERQTPQPEAGALLQGQESKKEPEVPGPCLISLAGGSSQRERPHTPQGRGQAAPPRWHDIQSWRTPPRASKACVQHSEPEPRVSPGSPAHHQFHTPSPSKVGHALHEPRHVGKPRLHACRDN